MESIHITAEIGVTEYKKRTMHAYVAGPAPGRLVVVSENGKIVLGLRRSRGEGESWEGKAFAVMTQEGARELVDQLARELGLNVIANAATIAAEMKA